MQKLWRSHRKGALARSVGAKIRAARQARGVRPETLASMLEIPVGFLARYESGDLLIPTYTLYQLSGALEVTMDYFFGENARVLQKERPPEVELVDALQRVKPPHREAIRNFVRTFLEVLLNLEGKLPD